MKQTLKIRLKRTVNIFLALVIALGAAGALAAGGGQLPAFADAASESDLAALKSAMESFESYMTTIYNAAKNSKDNSAIPTAKWLQSAYAAYTAAQQAYDKYCLGGAEEETAGTVSGVTDTLKSYCSDGSNKLTSYWTPKTGDAHQAYDLSYYDKNYVTTYGDSSADPWKTFHIYSLAENSSNSSVGFTVTDKLSGVLWTMGVKDEAPRASIKSKNKGSGTYNNAYVLQVVFGEVVFLYDGHTDLNVPFCACYRHDGGVWYPTSLYIESSDGSSQPFTLVNTYYHGDGSGNTFYTYGVGISNYMSKKGDGSVAGLNSTKYNETHYTLSNTLNYTGTPTELLTTYKKIQFKWTGADSSSGTLNTGTEVGTLGDTAADPGITVKGDELSASTEYDNTTKYAGTSQNIYVLNYKMLTDTMIDLLKNLTSYSEGGISTILTGNYSTAQTFDPNNAFTNINESVTNGDISAAVLSKVESVQTEMQNHIDGINSGTENKYNALREAIEDSKSTYTDGNENYHYCTPLWNAFTDAYQAAQSAIVQAANDNYATNSELDSIVSTLTTAKKALAGHQLEHVNETPVTCFEDGVTEHYTCTREGCGLNFKDADGNQLISDEELTEQCQGHKELKHCVYKAPTADDVGYKDHYYCTACGRDYWSEDDAKNDTAKGMNEQTQQTTYLSHYETVLFVLTMNISPAEGETLDDDFIVKISRGQKDTECAATLNEDGTATASFVVEWGSYLVSMDGWSYSYTVSGWSTGNMTLIQNLGTNITAFGTESNPEAINLTATKNAANARADSDSAVNNFAAVTSE